MNAARIGVLVLAIAAAGLAAFLARGLVTSNDEPVEPKLVEAPTTEVLVAGSNLQLGQRVAGGDLRWQRWPDTSMNGAYITRNQNPAAVEDYMGSV
ncbi:MAG: Flp pilus assembly protein CpaB, partial [Parvibaculum sp.]|nr:Flp pilus assembly protein CpaB [Parvibaculum sp.]